MVVSSAEAGLFGRIDSVGVIANQTTYRRAYLEEQVDVTYVDDEAGLRVGSALSLRLDNQNGGSLQGEIYHLYAEQQFSDAQLPSIKLGRMQRSDALGFYTLDGIELQVKYDDKGLKFYAGRAGRIDDFHFVSADMLLGGSVQWDRRPVDYRLDNVEIKSFTSRLELQHLQKGESESRLNWSLNGEGKLHQSHLSDLKLGFVGSYQFGQQQLDELLLSAELRDGRSEYLKLNYQSYLPATPTLTFREQYYSLYVLGRQSELAASYYSGSRKQLGWGMKGRMVTRENGLSGFGITGSLSRWRYAGADMHSQLDLLKLGDENAATLYLEGARPLTALRRMRLALVAQRQQKHLAGDNRAFGIDGEMEQMLSRSLYLSLNLTHIWNSRLADESKLSLRLSYRFDDRKGWTNE